MYVCTYDHITTVPDNQEARNKALCVAQSIVGWSAAGGSRDVPFRKMMRNSKDCVTR